MGIHMKKIKLPATITWKKYLGISHVCHQARNAPHFARMVERKYVFKGKRDLMPITYILHE